MKQCQRDGLIVLDEPIIVLVPTEDRGNERMGCNLDKDTTGSSMHLFDYEYEHGHDNDHTGPRFGGVCGNSPRRNGKP